MSEASSLKFRGCCFLLKWMHCKLGTEKSAFYACEKDIEQSQNSAIMSQVDTNQKAYIPVF